MWSAEALTVYSRHMAANSKIFESVVILKVAATRRYSTRFSLRQNPACDHERSRRLTSTEHFDTLNI